MYVYMTACAHLQVEIRRWNTGQASDLPPCARGSHTNDDPVL